MPSRRRAGAMLAAGPSRRRAGAMLAAGPGIVRTRRTRKAWMVRLVAGVVAALAVSIPPVAPARADVGHRDQPFAATSVTKPSGQKPQSKLWYVDGRWWG